MLGLVHDLKAGAGCFVVLVLSSRLLSFVRGGSSFWLVGSCLLFVCMRGMYFSVRSVLVLGFLMMILGLGRLIMVSRDLVG